MIDAHLHVWQIGQHGCVWPGQTDGVLYRDFDIDQWQVEAEACGVSGSVLIQTQEDDQDTQFLLTIAKQHASVKAIVGWVNLQHPQAVARLNQLRAQPKFRGVRPMLQSMGDISWLLSKELEPAINTLIAHQLVFDALVLTHQLPVLLAFVEKYPALTVVIDHAAKPAIAQNCKQIREQWITSLSLFAEKPKVFCKISGLFTEAGAFQDTEILVPYVRLLIKTFTATRLLWGSDWPVVTSASNPFFASFTEWFNFSYAVIAKMDPSALELIFNKNARIIYRIEK